jgi:hypothetical protein
MAAKVLSGSWELHVLSPGHDPASCVFGQGFRGSLDLYMQHVAAVDDNADIFMKGHIT